MAEGWGGLAWNREEPCVIRKELDVIALLAVGRGVTLRRFLTDRPPSSWRQVGPVTPAWTGAKCSWGCGEKKLGFPILSIQIFPVSLLEFRLLICKLGV